jgi:hypothetical protein
MDDKRTFLICPVRGHGMGETASIVDNLEKDGWDVYWPPFDTDQDDDTGLRICQDNLAAIKDRPYIHFIWNGESQGCLFDLGMAFALGKKVIVVSIPELTEGKSFQNMVTEWAGLAD